ncbi:unnamed protein product [Didymodactylos carnosus]|uniref:MADS-box domain-containing protein n=1 Tax=Didymodactylos carnosus TaxID=1234261 RepID=A0A8S2MSU4_9BILA|nr:unnamed protein product [Didymodactylos carnosus]CAF3972059.1 unnamed protein product [Didymodactylos carnosus]
MSRRESHFYELQAIEFACAGRESCVVTTKQAISNEEIQSSADEFISSVRDLLAKNPLQLKENRQHHTGKVSIEYKQDSTKRAQSKYRRRETLIKKIQEFSEITSIEATVVFRDSEKLYVDGPDDDMNASVENFLKRPEKKSSSAQYEMCLLCGEKKSKDVLCCALPKCAKVYIAFSQFHTPFVNNIA